MNTQRPLAVTIAAVLLALFSVLFDVSFPLWADAVPRDDGGAPAFIYFLTVAVGVVGLVAAAGLWMLRRWGIWLAIPVCVLNIFDGATGMASPYAVAQVAAAAVVAVFALIVVLVFLPSSRRAYA